jgi:hypothetical protein
MVADTIESSGAGRVPTGNLFLSAPAGDIFGLPPEALKAFESTFSRPL